MAKKKNEWLYRALCAALAVTLVSGTAVMSPVADIVGTSITANAANYTIWGTCQWKVENGKLYIKGTIPNIGSPFDIPWCADSIRTTITEVYVETGTKTRANASYLFYDLTNATSMDLSNLNTSAATDMNRMFSYCSSLASLNISGWNTFKVTDMRNMFYDCDALTSLDLSSWNTSSVKTMENMFYDCDALTSLNLSDWNTQNVTTMADMFYSCNSLKSVDVNGWNTQNVTSMFGMFSGCNALKKIYADKDWNTSAVTSYYGMFSNCENLVGGQGTAWINTTKTKEYARIDGGPASTTPGYFTKGHAPLTYTVTWKNYDGTTLETDEDVEEGTTPSYSGATPVRPANAQYTYTFNGWSPAVSKATANATYTAQFKQTVNNYTVTWKNYDGTTLQTDTIAYGTTPSYDGATPTKTATAQYTYTFSDWDKAIAAVTGDVTYTAQFSETTNTYTVTWVDGDGNTLKTDTVAYGDTPEYNGATPTKEGDAQYTYTFSDWDKAIAAVTGDVTYTAQFSETTNTYTVTWQNEDGTVLETDTDVAYGTTPSYDGETPVKPADAQYQYTFSGWTDGTNNYSVGDIPPVTGNVEYTVVFTAENHSFDNGICTVCGSKENYTITVTNGIVAKGEKDIYHVGDIITLKANTPEEGKVFAYWQDGRGNVLSTKANYSFVVLQSVDLTAVYNNEHTAKAILNISAVQTSSNGKNAIRFVFNRSVDTKAQVEEVGLIYATNKLAGYTDGAKVNLSESDFDIETALKDNTNGKVKTYKGTSTSINGTIRLTYTIGNNTDCYVYAYGYVKLTDGTTLYTDLIATTYDSIV